MSTGVFDIDDLAEDGPGLVAATSVLTNGLVQPFGVPEVLQMSRDGKIRIHYWNRRYGHDVAVKKWAESAGTELTEETLA